LGYYLFNILQKMVMKGKGILFALVLLFSYSSIFSQPAEGQDIHTTIQIYEEDEGHKIGLRFSFPEMTENLLHELVEIYVEFGLLGSIVQGISWPDYIFEVPCSEDIYDFQVNSLSDTVGLTGGGSTHFWRSFAPAEHLQYDIELGVYYLDLYTGFCPDHHKATEMIGYVDIILNASDPEGPEPLFPADNCTELSTQLYQALFTNQAAGTWGLGEQTANTVFHGPTCPNRGFRSSETNKSINPGQELIIYPNPASERLHLVQSATEAANLQLFDSKGQLVYSKVAQQQETIIALDGLAPGLYFLHHQTAKNQTLHKVMILPFRNSE